MTAPVTPEQTALVDSAVRRSVKRLIPFLLLMYVIAFLDRSNVGFAKEELEADIGLSAAAYALGAGCSSSATPSSRCPATSSCTRSAPAGGWPGSW